MSLMNSELYHALVSAGADEEKARGAASSVTEPALRNDITELRGELKLHRWMLGVNLVLTVAVLWQLFTLSTKVAALP